MLNFIVCLTPIIVLIVLMTKPRGWPSHVALPFTALLVYLIKLLHFGDDPNTINATVVRGILSALTPILIIAGAIFMFKTMELSGAMDSIRRWLHEISDNRVAQLMIIGWAFSFVIEGASGFGTPAALAAPILVGMGFAPLRVAVLCLVMNTVPVSFGAVGTATWFGMGQLGLGEEELLRIGFYSAIIHAFAATIIPPVALLFVIERREVLRNLAFVYLSIAACMVPYVILSAFSYEFPSLVGGVCGFVLTLIAAKRGIGLEKRSGTLTKPNINHPVIASHGGSVALSKATFPLWGSVLVLVVTRIPQLGIKALLTDRTPLFAIVLGPLGDLTVSRSAVLALDRILGADVSWTFEALYVPAFIPFFFISAIAILTYRMTGTTAKQLFRETYQRMAQPIVALLGALVMVTLLMAGGEKSMVMMIGTTFADATGDKWVYAASLLGALGSFFSGSATISNLTFGGIQNAIAAESQLSPTVVLALQSVGASFGNMISINNIVAVCSILGISRREGEILKMTIRPMLLYALVSAIVSQFL